MADKKAVIATMTDDRTIETAKVVYETAAAIDPNVGAVKEVTDTMGDVAGDLKIKSWLGKLQKLFKKRKQSPKKLAGDLTNVAVREGVSYAVRTAA